MDSSISKGSLKGNNVTSRARMFLSALGATSFAACVTISSTLALMATGVHAWLIFPLALFAGFGALEIAVFVFGRCWKS